MPTHFEQLWRGNREALGLDSPEGGFAPAAPEPELRKKRRRRRKGGKGDKSAVAGSSTPAAPVTAPVDG